MKTICDAPSSDTSVPVATIYAVGDVHGRFDLLERALDAIEADRPGAQKHVIFLGDYVDRGPQSREVIECLMGLSGQDSVTCLRGNHEQMMVDAYRGGSSEQGHWLGNGGVQTIASYEGVVPTEHLGWAAALPVIVRLGNRVFVHAGVMPGLPSEDQDDENYLWIRERFLRADPTDFDAHIVHGHTPVWACKQPTDVELLPHRTNLDTAAYHTGLLSIGVFNAAEDGGPAYVLTITANSKSKSEDGAPPQITSNPDGGDNG